MGAGLRWQMVHAMKDKDFAGFYCGTKAGAFGGRGVMDTFPSRFGVSNKKTTSPSTALG
jgi:hypothetical protein